MKTAMQQLIDFLEPELKMGDFLQLPAHEKAKQLLEAEKEQIMEAYNFGYREGFHDGKSCVSDEKDVSEFENAEQYHTQTFKSDE